jgi:hypothetical protein
MAAERPPLDNETINSNKTFYCLKLYKEHHALNKIRSEAQSTSSSFIRARIFLWRLIQPKKICMAFSLSRTFETPFEFESHGQ